MGYRLAADAVAILHLAWLCFVIGGALITRGRPALTIFHLGSILYGLAINIFVWPCPLTLLEQALRTQVGTGYTGSFISYYANRIIFPNVPQESLIAGAALLLVAHAALYGARLRARTPRWKR